MFATHSLCAKPSKADMTMINKFLVFVISLLTLGLVFGASATDAKAAPRLYLEPAAVTAAKGSEFEINLHIDAESQFAFGADAIINFTGSTMNVVSATKGDFFTDMSYGQSSGQLEIHAFFSNLFDSKIGTGKVATIKFAATAGSGTENITFACSGSGNDTQIIDTNGNDIISCGAINQANITFTGDGDTGSPSPSPDGEESPPPGSDTTPNNCSEGCSENRDCKSDLICYRGSCKNPTCVAESDCSCSSSVTTTNTKKAALPKSTTKPKSTPSTQKVTLEPYEKPTPAPEETAEPEEGVREGFAPTTTLVILGALSLVALVFLLLSYLKKRRPPEKINLDEGVDSPPNESEQ